LGNPIQKSKPWYNEKFDSDLEKGLDERKIITKGKKFLDQKSRN
jgi:hypothetical protein